MASSSTHEICSGLVDKLGYTLSERSYVAYSRRHLDSNDLRIGRITRITPTAIQMRVIGSKRLVSVHSPNLVVTLPESHVPENIKLELKGEAHANSN